MDLVTLKNDFLISIIPFLMSIITITETANLISDFVNVSFPYVHIGNSEYVLSEIEFAILVTE